MKVKGEIEFTVMINDKAIYMDTIHPPPSNNLNNDVYSTKRSKSTPDSYPIPVRITNESNQRQTAILPAVLLELSVQDGNHANRSNLIKIPRSRSKPIVNNQQSRSAPSNISVPVFLLSNVSSVYHGNLASRICSF